ncbi:MAG: TIGR03084 family protein [Parvularculaceae bacterium]|nr:TIGR03084 family protein [Parvularculaceae bacterium]
MHEADDFLKETTGLAKLLLDANLDLDQPTLFKSWTGTQIIRHLHCWNEAALLSTESTEAFQAMLMEALPKVAAGGMRGYEDEAFQHLTGSELISTWQASAERTAGVFRSIDPERRLPWAGPPMSAQSSISARLMETWAHGQALYDLAGRARIDGDHIRPIAELGVRTFGWTYQVRGEQKPSIKPHVRLTAPSGAIWTFNPEHPDERIEGSATAFCQVVTQTRNIADVDLVVKGDVATDWMHKAQCFAGPPEAPPAPGQRHMTEHG